jgi:hypothetical protein
MTLLFASLHNSVAENFIAGLEQQAYGFHQMHYRKHLEFARVGLTESVRKCKFGMGHVNKCVYATSTNFNRSGDGENKWRT